NLHNASRAHVPIVNIVGEHPAHHREYDPPLNSDIEALARPYWAWLRTASSSSALGADAANAIAAARTAPGHIATLIVPADVAWSEGGAIASVLCPPLASMPATEAIE